MKVKGASDVVTKATNGAERPRTGRATPLDFARWNVDSLRLTVFYPDLQPSPGVWKSVRGVEPDSIESKPHEGTLVEHGPVDGAMLLLTSGLNRRDWHLQTPSGLQPGPTSLLITDSTEGLFQKVLNTSLKDLAQVIRLAFGATLSQPCQSPQEGLSILSEYLPHLNLGVYGDLDFMYRINRRRTSPSSPHVQINRVATWSLDQVYSGAIKIGLTPNPEVTSVPSFSTRLVLDVNTVPTRTATSIKRYPTLFNELLQLACEIAKDGDTL